MSDTRCQQVEAQTSYPITATAQPEDTERSRLLQVMTRVNDITRRSDISDLIQGVLDLMVEIAHCDSANFFQLDEEKNELVITHICGEVENRYLIGLRLNRQQGLPGLALAETRAVVVGDLHAEPDWLLVTDPLAAGRKRNVIHLPVTNNDRTLGVIQLFNFQQAELDLLQVLSGRLGLEIERWKEMRQSQQSKEQLFALVEMLGNMAGTLDRNRLLHQVTENASRLVGADRSSIFLVDPTTREMIFQVAYQSPEPVQPGIRPVLNSGQLQHKRFVQTAPFQNGEFSHFNRSAITVPIHSDQTGAAQPGNETHVLGGLMVLNNQNAHFKLEDAQLMQILAHQASINLQITEMYESAGDLFLGVIKALAAAIDAKDPYTQGHSQRVSDYAVLIAKELGFDEAGINDVRIGSLFHDIGKIGIPDAILLKNGKLTDLEFEYMRQHPRTGANILNQVRLMEPMVPAILQHHERLDGSGYPARLSGSQISWMGRIVAVADVFDAMTSNRPYRAAYSREEVLSYLRAHSRALFDAECVQALDVALNRSRPQGRTPTGRLNPDSLK